MAWQPLFLIVMGLWGPSSMLAKLTASKPPKCTGALVRVASTNATLNHLLSAWSERPGGCRGVIRLKPSVYQLDQEYIFDGAFDITLSGPKPRRGSPFTQSAYLLQPASGGRLFTAASGAQLTLEYLGVTKPDIGAIRRRALSMMTYLKDVLFSNKKTQPPTAIAEKPQTNYQNEQAKPVPEAPLKPEAPLSSTGTVSGSACPAFAPDLDSYGGAVLAYGCANSTIVTTLNIINCRFEGFTSWMGGAITTGPGTRLNMQNSLFRLNTAQSFLDPVLTPKYGFGGAVAVLGTAKIKSCMFLSNGAYNEAGALGWCPTATTDTFDMQDSLVSSNLAGQYGGGASLTDGTYQYGSVTCLFASTPAKLQAVRFANNAALEDQVLGGALYLGQNSEVSCSLFANNTANELSLNTDSWGGAIYVSGFYRSLPDETKVKLDNVYFAGNVAEFGKDGWVDSYSTVTALSYTNTSSRNVETRSGLIAKPVIIPCQPPARTRHMPATNGQGESQGLFDRSMKERGSSGSTGGNNSSINDAVVSGGVSQCSGLCYPPRIPSAPMLGLPPATGT